MREEYIIRRKFGKKEPFTVPENYFADFADRLMNELPEKNAPVEEGIVSIPRRIEGVQVAVAFRENPSGSYKISVRTGEGADASAICRNFGGGGHVRAAGCTMTGNVRDVVNNLTSYMEQQLTQDEDL